MMRHSRFAKIHVLASFAFTALLPFTRPITGQAAFAGYAQQKPGVRRKITVANLPEPKSGDQQHDF